MYYSAGHIIGANLKMAVMLVKAFYDADLFYAANTCVKNLVAEFNRTDFTERFTVKILS